MAFNKQWFDELRGLSEQSIANVTPKSFRPAVDELYVSGFITSNFLNTTLDLVKDLNKTRFTFSPLFRVYPSHICNFPRGKAFRKQWNIGFFAGDSSSETFARIGIGFSLNSEMSSQGIDEYSDFIARVAERKSDFDDTFALSGNYAEPFGTETDKKLSTLILSDKPDFKDDWRFYGKMLRLDNNSDRDILSSIDTFVLEAVDVFTTIEKAGF